MRWRASCWRDGSAMTSVGVRVDSDTIPIGYRYDSDMIPSCYRHSTVLLPIALRLATDMIPICYRVIKFCKKCCRIKQIQKFPKYRPLLGNFPAGYQLELAENDV